MTQITITWEHGDADFETTTTQKIDNVDEFLGFMLELVGVRDGEIIDDHYTCIKDHYNPILERYPQYEDYMVYDEKYGCHDYRARVSSIHLEDNGIRKNILWMDLISPNKPLPIPNEIIEISTWQIVGGSYDKNIKLINSSAWGKGKFMVTGRVIGTIHEKSGYEDNICWLCKFGYLTTVKTDKGIVGLRTQGFFPKITDLSNYYQYTAK